MSAAEGALKADMKKSSIVLILIVAQAGFAAAGNGGRTSGKAYQQLAYSASAEADISVPVPAAPSAYASGGDSAEGMSFVKGDVPPGPQAPANKSGLDASYFGTFGSLFDMGKPATPEDMTGWYSGRYVYITNPDTLYGSIMVGSPYSSGFWVALPKQQQDPAYYDVMDSTKTALVKSAIDHGHGLVVSFPEASGSYTYMGPDGPIVYTMEYKKFQGEIIEKMSTGGKAVGYTRYLTKVTPDEKALAPAQPAAAVSTVAGSAAGPKPAGQGPADADAAS